MNTNPWHADYQDFDVNSLSYRDFSDSRHLKNILQHMIISSEYTESSRNNRTSKLVDESHCVSVMRQRSNSKTESFLRIAVPLLNISLLGRMMLTEHQLRNRLHTLLNFYNNIQIQVQDCVNLVFKVNDFENESQFSPNLSTIGSNGHNTSDNGSGMNSFISSSNSSWIPSNVILCIECITMMVIDASILSTEIKQVIESLNSKHHEFNTITISKYFDWVFNNKRELHRSCQSAEIITCIDKKIRGWIKGEIYETPMQIIGTYNMKYKDYLTNIELPSLSFIYHDRNQCIKDIQREFVLINGSRVDVCHLQAIITKHLHAACRHSDNKSISALEFDDDAGHVQVDNEAEIEQSELATVYFNRYINVVIDFAYSHVITGASRTEVSGDIYQILQDLYGDEENLALLSNKSNKYELKIRIEIINKELVIIEMMEIFNLCMKRAMESPFMSFKTKSISHIKLKEMVCVLRASLMDNQEEPLEEGLQRRYILDELLQSEHKLCWRKVSIEPFLETSAG